MRTAAVNLPWGTPVRIDFTREKITLPTPKCSFGLASDEVPQGYQEQKAIYFCLTCDVEQEQ